MQPFLPTWGLSLLFLFLLIFILLIHIQHPHMLRWLLGWKRIALQYTEAEMDILLCLKGFETIAIGPYLKMIERFTYHHNLANINLVTMKQRFQKRIVFNTKNNIFVYNIVVLVSYIQRPLLWVTRDT